MSPLSPVSIGGQQPPTVPLFLCLQPFDPVELLECIRALVRLEQDWVPRSEAASLYIRPTFIGTEVGTMEGGQQGGGWGSVEGSRGVLRGLGEV